MNNENLQIERDTILQAQEICNFITEPAVRNRAVANIISVKTVLNYFADCDVDVTTGLHNISEILKFWEISDIYVNGAYIDVRLHFNDNDICVPKYHFDNNLLPKVYMFIKIDEAITNATVTGFINPEAVNTTTNYSEYYQVKASELKDFSEICELLEPNEPEFVEDLEMLLYDYIDDIESKHERISKHLLTSPELRIRLAAIVNAKNTFNYISIDSILAEAVEGNKEDQDEELTINLESIREENLINSNILEKTPNNILLEDASKEEFLLDGYEANETLILDENSPDEYINEFSTEITPSINSIESLLSEDNETIENILVSEEEHNQVFDDNRALEVEEAIEEVSDIESLRELSYEYENADSDIEKLYPNKDYSESNESDMFNDLSDALENNETAVLDHEVSSQDSISTLCEEDLLDENDDFNKNEFKNSDDKTNNSQDENSEIDELFDNEQEVITSEYIESAEKEQQKTKSIKILPLLGALVIVGAIGYYSFTKYNSSSQDNSFVDKPAVTATNSTTKNNDNIAMPVESIENDINIEQEEQGVSMSLPQIEENLDASILVSNLSINWEVPVSYVSNATAKRYFTKVGKIVQMNLKTDLLLLNKPPITNKITLGLEFNKSTQKFKVKNVILSSGEEQIDEMIKNTVNNTLNSNFNFNMNVFNDLPGNPSLVIHL